MTASPSPCLCFFWLMPLFPSWLCRPTCCPSIYWDVRIDSHGLCVPSCWSCFYEAAFTQLGGSAPHVSGAALSFPTPSHMRSVCGSNNNNLNTSEGVTQRPTITTLFFSFQLFSFDCQSLSFQLPTTCILCSHLAREPFSWQHPLHHADIGDWRCVEGVG